MKPPKPECPAMILCRSCEVHDEDRTTLHSIFHITTRAPQDIYIYFALIGLRGQYELHFVIENEGAGDVLRPPLREVIGTDNPGTTMQSIFSLRGFGFARAGVHYAKLYANDELVAQRSFRVVDDGGADLSRDL